MASASQPFSTFPSHMSYPSITQSWFSNIRGDLLAGIVVALALIPEASAFSIIAGVDPKVGLYDSFQLLPQNPMSTILTCTDGSL